MDRVAELLPEHAPCIGDLVEVRSRRWLVEAVEEPPDQCGRVSLACADDDAQGQTLEVYWDFEIDRRILKQEAWSDLGSKGFDPPRHFSAFLHTLRWNCVTATDPSLFQSPFRAGIKIDAYQMEPLRKALRLARVNLFIADDTGLGKTIAAGLIARELLLRKKARTIVVAAPASVLEQWKGEMEERLGLLFVILDRAYLAQVRRERGFGVNPWRMHSRFLVSHNLLIDPAYADPMREWLGDLSPGNLLILDEAHHAAPSSGGRYGIETKFARAIRDLGGRFEHRLFLSATPHNGHSNSFATLLELLDPYCFTRGVPEYERNGVGHLLMYYAPFDEWRRTDVAGDHTASTWAEGVCRLVADDFPTARRITLVMDNLNTHSGASLYKSFPPAKGRALLDKLEFVFTPKHGSRLNMAEMAGVEFSVLSQQCLDRRIADIDTLSEQVSAWTDERNRTSAPVNWRFTTADARIKLRHLYPVIKE